MRKLIFVPILGIGVFATVNAYAQPGLAIGRPVNIENVDVSQPEARLVRSPNLTLQGRISRQGGCGSMAVPEATNPNPNNTGFYEVDIGSGTRAVVYCDNRTVYNGIRGGWTLVWSNLRGGRGKLTSDLHWGASIETLPRYRGMVTLLNNSPDLQSFEVFTGLRWWRSIAAEPGGRREILYRWAANYSPDGDIDRSAACSFRLNPDENWRISFVGPCAPLPGTTNVPDFFTTHNGHQWTTVDRDNDAYPSNCASIFSGTPWWYTACWGGSVNGGGEAESNGNRNGAYWNGSDVRWGSVNGTGAGNGWIYVR